MDLNNVMSFVDFDDYLSYVGLEDSESYVVEMCRDDVSMYYTFDGMAVEPDDGGSFAVTFRRLDDDDYVCVESVSGVILIEEGDDYAWFGLSYDKENCFLNNLQFRVDKPKKL